MRPLLRRVHRLSLLVALVSLQACPATATTPVRVGSKAFTEGVLLGEIMLQLLQSSEVPAKHVAALGGTRLTYAALRNGEIDVAVEYTGTLRKEIFDGDDLDSWKDIEARLAEDGITLAGKLGFENNFALGMPEKTAAERGIKQISDLARHPDLRFRFGTEFMLRPDGWPGVRAAYSLPQGDVQGIDHDLAYRALAAGDADLTDVYTTDAEIDYYGMRSLVDDKAYFSTYDAVLLYRDVIKESHPRAIPALTRVLDSIDTTSMAVMNAAVKIEGRSEAEVAEHFAQERYGIEAADSAGPAGMVTRVARRTVEHLALVAMALAISIPVAVPLGIIACRRQRLGHSVLGAVGVAQTIPTLALLVVLVPVFGIGTGTAVCAVCAYALLPIVRNTYAGLKSIDPHLVESAIAMGLSRRTRLLRVELPLALPTMLAGIKIAAVTAVGTATLGALIGAGGYGQPILTGIRRDDAGLILEGAIPAAALALLLQALFDLVEKRLVRYRG